MAIAYSEQVPIVHHKIFNEDEGILIDLIFFICGETFAIAEGVFGDKVNSLNIFIFAVLSE